MFDVQTASSAALCSSLTLHVRLQFLHKVNHAFTDTQLVALWSLATYIVNSILPYKIHIH